MSQVYDFFFAQYNTYDSIDIALELIAFVFNIASVWFSKKNNIWVFPTGMIGTAIFVYLLYKFDLLGDMFINGYYFIMSIYGWYFWSKKDKSEQLPPITRVTNSEKRTSIIIFICTMMFVVTVYYLSDKFNTWMAYVDTLTTAIFFVGMWLMAKRKIESWTYWIIGNIITIPLYFYKGLTFSSLLYIVLTVIAIYGYIEWKKNLDKTLATA